VPAWAGLRMGLSAAKVTGCNATSRFRRSHIRDGSGSTAHIFGSDRFRESRSGVRRNGTLQHSG